MGKTSIQGSQRGRFLRRGMIHGGQIQLSTSTTPHVRLLCVLHNRRLLTWIVLPLRFEPLPLGSIKPLGWLGQQLDLMADGLPGHLHEFYRHIKNATWLGGHEEYSCTHSLGWSTDY